MGLGIDPKNDYAFKCVFGSEHHTRILVHLLNAVLDPLTAAGLGKLARGGKDCLKARLGKETSANVKKMIEKAIRLIDEAAAGPVLGEATR